MSDPDDKNKFRARRSRNYIAKALRDTGDMKGAFALKIVEPKNNYRRERVSVRNLEKYIEDED